MAAALFRARAAMLAHVVAIGDIAFAAGDRRLVKLSASLFNVMKEDERNAKREGEEERAPVDGESGV